MATMERNKFYQLFVLFALSCLALNLLTGQYSSKKDDIVGLLHGRRTTGREIAAELAEHRKEYKMQSPTKNNAEILDLTMIMENRAVYYNTKGSSYPQVSLKRGISTVSSQAIAKRLHEERSSRFASSSSTTDFVPSAKLMPLVVLVAGLGAEQAWPSLIHLDAARLPVLSKNECDDNERVTEAKFDLILLVPMGDKTSLLPCVGSQGCKAETIGNGLSGLRVIHGQTPKSSNEDLLAQEALKLYDRSLHSCLVIVSASSIVSATSIDLLIAQVKPSIAPAQLDIAVPLIYGSFGGGSASNSIDKWYSIQASGSSTAEILPFVGHPLNVARIQLALNELPPYDGIDYESGIFDESFIDDAEGKSSSGLSVVALSPKALTRLVIDTDNMADKTHHGGLVHGLKNAAQTYTDLNSGIVRRAFVHSNLGYQHNVMDSIPPRSSSSSSSTPPPISYAVKPSMKVQLSSQTTLVGICAAGVPDKTVSVLHSLEAAIEEHFSHCSGSTTPSSSLSCSSPFHVLVGVSPFPGDRTADYLETAGVFVLRQPAPLGLSDLWNRIFRFAFIENGYSSLIYSNNDVLIAPGAVAGVNALLRLEPQKIATVNSQQGGSTDSLANEGFALHSAPEDVIKFAEHSLNYRIVQKHLVKSSMSCNDQQNLEVMVPYIVRKQFVGFFWGITRKLGTSLLLPDGSGRLINTTARLNFGQETEIVERLGKGSSVSIIASSYVHHFRGQTLGGCQNGHRDCAQWQIGHHADASYHINGYAPKVDAPRTIAWWEPSFHNLSPFAWKEQHNHKSKDKKHNI